MSPVERKGYIMTAVDELVGFILNLTPEQANKIIDRLPQLSSSLEEPYQPCLNMLFYWELKNDVLISFNNLLPEIFL